MKKILLASLISLMAVSTVNAQARCCWRGYYGGWVAPAVIGGVVGYELARPATVIVQQQPTVVYTAPSPTAPVMVQQPPVGYHWQQIVDPSTSTQKMALVPN